MKGTAPGTVGPVRNKVATIAESLDFRTLWAGAMAFPSYVADSTRYRGLWEGVHRLARIPEWALVRPAGTRRRFLVISEDWCGDASNTVPVLARWVETSPGLELRIIRRDEHPDVMDRYLTDGSRSIPIVVALDEDFREIGHWGPRPTELQAWVMANQASLPKAEVYPQVRRWYARDKGESAIREVMEVAGLSGAAR